MAGAEPSLARQREPLVVAGSEVVGRSLAIWSAQLMEWPKAVITGHDPATGRHAIKYRGRAGPETTETWVNLARTRFQWVGKPPPGAAPNPSAKSAPPDEALVGCRVKVFWPGMAKWYLGKVVGFDAKTRQHSIKYRDGDAQHLTLRHEAVQYVDVPSPAAGPSPPKSASPGAGKEPAGGARPAKRQRGRGPTPDSGTGTGGGDAPRSGLSSFTAEARPGARGGSSPGAVDGPVQPKRRRGRPSAADAAAAAARARAPPSAGPARSAAARGAPDAPRRGPRASDSLTSGFSSDSSGSSGTSDDEEDTSTRTGSPSPDSSSLATSRDDGSRSARDRASGALEGAAPDSEYEVESARPGRPRAGAAPGASRRAGAAQPRRRRDAAGRAAATRAAYETPGGARRVGRPAGAAAACAAHAGSAPATPPAAHVSGSDAVGARVALLWREDAAWYRGRLVQYDSYHKRHKIAYDDGEEEWVSLSRESFRVLTPRGASAAAPGSKHWAALAALGAEGRPRPGAGSSRGAAAAAAAAAAEAPPASAPTPADVRGAALSVRCPGDGRWHRGVVLDGGAGAGERALVVYEDGEDEWLALGRESLAWHGAGAERDRAARPAGAAAAGWRVGVYRPAERRFAAGEVTAVDDGGGGIRVTLDDGQCLDLDPNEPGIKWTFAPGITLDAEKLGRRRGPAPAAGDAGAWDAASPRAYQRSRYTLARPSAFSRRQQSLSRLAVGRGTGCASPASPPWPLSPAAEAGAAARWGPAEGSGPPRVVRCVQAGSVAALGTLGRLCSTAVGGGAGTGTPRATDLPVRIYLSASSCSGDEGAQATLRALCGLAPAGSGAATHGRGGSDSPSSPERGVSLGASPGDSAGGQPAQRPSPFASPGQPALAGSDTEEEEEDALDQLRVAGLVKEEEELPQVLPQIPVGARSTAVAS
ncbi:hypothetical protein ACKKBF_B37530 [Auxenochlorella protothecoides x Auxenochlorella symbiontica]